MEEKYWQMYGSVIDKQMIFYRHFSGRKTESLSFIFLECCGAVISEIMRISVNLGTIHFSYRHCVWSVRRESWILKTCES